MGRHVIGYEVQKCQRRSIGLHAKRGIRRSLFGVWVKARSSRPTARHATPGLAGASSTFTTLSAWSRFIEMCGSEREFGDDGLIALLPKSAIEYSAARVEIRHPEAGKGRNPGSAVSCGRHDASRSKRPCRGQWENLSQVRRSYRTRGRFPRRSCVAYSRMRSDSNRRENMSAVAVEPIDLRKSFDPEPRQTSAIRSNCRPCAKALA